MSRLVPETVGARMAIVSTGTELEELERKHFDGGTRA
jgi:hypothetical protein